jgi:hypothetical protein
LRSQQSPPLHEPDLATQKSRKIRGNAYPIQINLKLAESRDNQTYRSSLFERREIEKAQLSEPKRVVHKNWSFEKFNQQKITHENAEMVSRILGSQCQILKKDLTEQSFKNHMRYQNIRRRYNESGQRKDVLPLCESEMLCPTLLQFNNSGLASKFVEMDMSMSIKPATAQSLRRSAMSNTPV